MGLFGGNRQRRLERRAARVQSKLDEVRGNQAPVESPKIALGQQKNVGLKIGNESASADISGMATDVELQSLKEYTDKGLQHVREQIAALDTDVGEVNRNAKMRKRGGGGGGGFGGGLLPLLLLGGLGGTGTSTLDPILLLALFGGFGGDDDEGGGFPAWLLFR